MARWYASSATAAGIRLVGVILADMHGEWQSGGRRYLSEGSMANLNQPAILAASPGSNLGWAARHRRPNADAGISD